MLGSLLAATAMTGPSGATLCGPGPAACATGLCGAIGPAGVSAACAGAYCCCWALMIAVGSATSPCGAIFPEPAGVSTACAGACYCCSWAQVAGSVGEMPAVAFASACWWSRGLSPVCGSSSASLLLVVARARLGARLLGRAAGVALPRPSLLGYSTILHND